MRFECLNEECKRQFMYTAKTTQVRTETDLVVTAGSVTVMPPYNTVETSVCPYCHSLNFDEIKPEPVEEQKTVSVKSVDLDQVDEMLTQGYVVHALYAKNAVLIKKEEANIE